MCKAQQCVLAVAGARRALAVPWSRGAERSWPGFAVTGETAITLVISYLALLVLRLELTICYLVEGVGATG